MPETKSLERGDRSSTTWTPDAKDWVMQGLPELLERGYHQRFDFDSAPFQIVTVAETKLDGIMRDTDPKATGIQPLGPLVTSLLVFDALTPLHPSSTMHALQEWEGYVIERGENRVYRTPLANNSCPLSERFRLA